MNVCRMHCPVNHSGLTGDESLSALLKVSTKDVHRSVETSTIMRQLMKGTLPLEQYVHLLRALEAIYACVF